MTGTRAIFPIHRSGLYSSSKNRLAGQAIGHVTIREDSLSRTIRRYPAKGLSRIRARGRWDGGAGAGGERGGGPRGGGGRGGGVKGAAPPEGWAEDEEPVRRDPVKGEDVR